MNKETIMQKFEELQKDIKEWIEGKPETKWILQEIPAKHLEWGKTFDKDKMKIERIQIKQRKEDCHYETIMWDNFHWYPIYEGYGFTQEEADTNCLEAFLKGKYYILEK